MLRPDLQDIVDRLVRETKAGEAVELDLLGDAIGARAVAQDEIDAMLRAIEAAGRRVATPPGGKGEATLKTVLDSARVLRAELGRAPRPREIAERAGISEAEVQHALSLARIIQR